MKCSKCGNEIQVKLASKMLTKGAKVITSLTTILTVKCDKCDNIFQISVQGNSMLSINKDNNL